MKTYKDFTYKIFWSEEDQEWVGTTEEWPLMSHLDVNFEEASKGIMLLIAYTLSADSLNEIMNDD